MPWAMLDQSILIDICLGEYTALRGNGKRSSRLSLLIVANLSGFMYWIGRPYPSNAVVPV